MNKRTLTVFFLTSVLVTCVYTRADSIPVANHSFEIIEIDPATNPQLGIPLVALWTELDNDP
ncbi:MAG: hypothetical protein ACYSOY_00675, partial [Planctomycetota bacterium]